MIDGGKRSVGQRRDQGDRRREGPKARDALGSDYNGYSSPLRRGGGGGRHGGGGLEKSPENLNERHVLDF